MKLHFQKTFSDHWFKRAFLLFIFYFIVNCKVSAQSRKNILSVCSPDDPLSQKVCRCSANVVSCDFTSLKSEQGGTVVEVEGEDIEPSVKRLCLCETPQHISLRLGTKFLSGSNIIHRIDLYNIHGNFDVHRAFWLHFSGNLFAENIKNWTKIESREFGRGADWGIPLENTQSLSCCSKISTPKFGMPTLYIKNSLVNYIENAGISTDHLWRSVIINGLTVKDADKNAIALLGDRSGLDVSITNSVFEKLKERSIRLMDVDNVVLAKCNFTPSCNPNAFVARSDAKNSVVAIINNVFANVMVWQLDAHNIINWFNWYDFWHQPTFLDLNRTRLQKRIISIEFNTVGNYINADFPFLQGDQVVFNENTISNCSCNIFAKGFPAPLQGNTNRCHQQDKNGRQCAVNLQKVQQQCSNNQKLGDNMCSDRTSATLTTNVDMNWGKSDFKAKGLQISSSFITKQLEMIGTSIHQHKILQARRVSSGVGVKTVFLSRGQQLLFAALVTHKIFTLANP